MPQDYYGTKRITAWPEGRDGKAGYAVKYPDGYISWSPAAAFEAAYQPITAMNFGHALQAMREGHRVARAGWNGKGMWLKLQFPDANSKMTVPYPYMKTADGEVVPWLCSLTDMLADDWQIVDDDMGYQSVGFGSAVQGSKAALASQELADRSSRKMGESVASDRSMREATQDLREILRGNS